jgi:hypothetical protein
VETAVLLLILRIASAALIVAFVTVVFVMLWRDYRTAVVRSREGRRSYGLLVEMVEIDGKMIKTGATYPLLPQTSIGRGPTNAVPIEDTYASSEHALVIRRGDQWWLEDRQSRNGTNLNGMRVEKPVVITQDDIIGIGRQRFRLELQDTTP